MLPIVIIGGGGHAAVLAETALQAGMTVAGYLAPEVGNRRLGPYLGDDAQLAACFSPDQVRLLIGVGSTRPTRLRKSLYDSFAERGYAFGTLVHPSAIISPSAKLGSGAQVLAGCIVQAGVAIGDNVILNTGVSVDHDSVIEAHAHVAPRAVVCGGVRVGQCAHIGAGAILIQNSKVAEDGFVRAGEVVNHA
jgi:UDP-perosamine 4-acetyltransferase